MLHHSIILQFSHIMCQYQYLVCPIKYSESLGRTIMNCTPSPLFQYAYYKLPENIVQIVSLVSGYISHPSNIGLS